MIGAFFGAMSGDLPLSSMALYATVLPLFQVGLSFEEKERGGLIYHCKMIYLSGVECGCPSINQPTSRKKDIYAHCLMT